MPTVLVTGATGIIGSELASILDSQAIDFVTTSRATASSPRHYSADLTFPEQAVNVLARVAPDVVVHLAGGQRATAADLYRDNVITTVVLLQSADRQRRRPYVIVAGSSAEYGEAKSARVSEEAPLQPVTDYGRAKLAQTVVARVLAAERGVPLTIIRPFNVVSPRLPSSTALGNIRRQLLEQYGPRRLVSCGRVDIVRDYVPAEFVAEALAWLVANPRPGMILNVCSGIGIELSAIIREMAEQLRVKVDFEHVDRLIALPAPTRFVGDPSRLRKLGLHCSVDAATVARTVLGSNVEGDGARAEET